MSPLAWSLMIALGCAVSVLTALVVAGAVRLRDQQAPRDADEEADR